MSKRGHIEAIRVDEKRRRIEIDDDGGQRLASGDYTVGWICAIQTEYVAARAFLDEEYKNPESILSDNNDNNVYTLGRIGEHNVVVTVLPREYGIAAATSVARDMLNNFPNIKVGLMVGIGGGAPSPNHDIRLGDIAVSTPCHGYGGVFQYDLGKTIQDQPFQQTGSLNPPPTFLLAATTALATEYEEQGHRLQNAIDSVFQNMPRLRKKYKRPDRSSDRLYRSTVVHPPNNKSECAAVCGDDSSKFIIRPERIEDDPVIHYGLIASANQVMRNAIIRDKYALEKEILCFEMEAAGLMNHFPCLVIRGICDYADTHKNKDWQGYAAMASAAYAKDLLRRIPKSRVEAQKTISDILASDRERDTRDAILNWLTSIDFSPQQSDFIGRRQQGTGQWFLDSTQFRSWIQTDKQTLFCPGIPGAGKTMLTSIVVEELISRVNNTNEKIGVAYVYCMFQRQNEQKADDLLASVLKQLTRDQFPLPENVKSLYNNHKDGQQRPSFDIISSVLQSVTVLYSRVFIVIDALDECSDRCRERLLPEIFKIQSQTGANIFTTSRYIPTIVNEFEGCASLPIHANESDVMKYIDGHIPSLQPCVQNNYVLQAMIKSRIAKSVGGMFLLAQLYMDSLIDKTTPNKINDALEIFPKGPSALSRAYGQAIKRIRSQREGFRRLAEEILLWLTCAKRLLTTLELRHALSVKPHTTGLDENDLEDANVITAFCAGLVTVDKESNVVRLVHDTARDFLETHVFCLTGKSELEDGFPLFNHEMNDMAMMDAHEHIMVICVTYLSFNIFESGVCEMDQLAERFRSNPLYSYATSNWGHHARAASMKAERFILDFLGNEAKVSASCQAMMFSNTYIGFDHQTPWIMTGIHLAAFFGLRNDITLALIQNKHDPDVKDSYWRTPLSWAAEKGHKAMVNLLLEQAEVDINSEDKVGRTPLSLAAENGHEAVVETLLARHDVDAHTWDVYDQTPLSWATENGHEGIVNLLLGRDDVDVNYREMYTQKTPLSIAAEKGYEGVMKLLLSRHDVDADHEDGVGRTPLSLAAENGHNTIVDLLLTRNDVNAHHKDKYGRTALWWAGTNRHEETIRVLLEKAGIDRCSTDNSYGQISPLLWVIDAVKDSHVGRKPLLLAAEKGYKAIVQLLFDIESIDPDPIDEAGRTPLSWAAEKGHADIIELLLDRGANIDFMDHGGQTPLLWAAEKGPLTVINLLLDKGANPDLIDGTGQTPLLWAAKKGHVAFINILLDRSADIDSIDPDGRTPLSWAVEKRHVTTAHLLLDRGTSVDYMDRGGRTPLLWAAKTGNVATVHLLLDRGASVDSTDRGGRTPLSWAAGKGHVDIINLLYDRGANIHSKDRDGQTPLWWAMEQEHEVAVKLLLGKSDMRMPTHRDYDQNALGLAARYGDEKLVRELLKEGVNIELKDLHGRTALSWAAKEGQKAIVKLLLETDAVELPSKIEDYDCERLGVAAQYGHKDIVKLLVERGTNIESNNWGGNTPLIWAAKEGRKGIVRLLLEKGAEIEPKGQGSGTPLSWAARGGYDGIVKLLIEKGANTESKDWIGKTPLSWAREKDHTAVIKLLLGHKLYR